MNQIKYNEKNNYVIVGENVNISGSISGINNRIIIGKSKFESNLRININ